MSVLHLCVVLFVTVVTVEGLTVNEDCSRDSCSAGLTCQENRCKKNIGETCGNGNECLINSVCSNHGCKCLDPYEALMSNTVCAKLVHTECTVNSDCVPNAECVSVTTGVFTRKLCQCQATYTWSVEDKTCNAAPGLAASLLLVALIFVTSRLL